MQNTAIFLINLDTDTDRLEKSKTLLQQNGLSFVRLPAVYGKNADQTPSTNAFKATGCHLTNGEVGCFLSHRLAARSFLETDRQLALVLEDDVDLTQKSLETIHEFSQTWRALPRWDVANLARPVKHQFTEIQDWNGPQKLFKAHYMPMTTTAILWNRTGAEAFLESSHEFVYPVDVHIQRWVSVTGKGLAFLEPPFGSRGDESTIGSSRKNKPGAFSKARRHQWSRILATHLAARKHKRNERATVS